MRHGPHAYAIGVSAQVQHDALPRRDEGLRGVKLSIGDPGQVVEHAKDRARRVVSTRVKTNR
jgi:hypothetical protein